MKNNTIKSKLEFFTNTLIFTVIIACRSFSQNFVPADPYHLLRIEKSQFLGSKVFNSNLFRPIFYNSDSLSFSILFQYQSFFNDNAPNQENMDIRYFSKGVSHFSSIQLSFDSKFFSAMIEPYTYHSNNIHDFNTVPRSGYNSVLNDQKIDIRFINNGVFRNLLFFLNYKGLGVGYHKGNKWWGPGIHTSLQMTNNTYPIPSFLVGTIKEIRLGKIGLFGLYSFSKMNNLAGIEAKYLTSLNGGITWYGGLILSAGFSRNFLSGGSKVANSNYVWSESDAKKIVFEGFFTYNLLENEYSIGGHDEWDQTLSAYIIVTDKAKSFKAYAEFGFNDNRMYFADFLSQPDHSMSTIIGLRHYLFGDSKNWLWGFEWTNLMITYTSRFRPSGAGAWYTKGNYDYSSFNGRRWGAHSGTDSDDWFLYAGYLSNKFMFVPSLNYERHGIVTHRPAEVKLEFKIDSRLMYKNTWFGITYEKQFEAFLGFPNYFYTDKFGNPTDNPNTELANTRYTNTLVFTIYKYLSF